MADLDLPHVALGGGPIGTNIFTRSRLWFFRLFTDKTESFPVAQFALESDRLWRSLLLRVIAF